MRATESLEITQKIIWMVLNTIFSLLENVSKHFCEYIGMEYPSYKNENIEWKKIFKQHAKK